MQRVFLVNGRVPCRAVAFARRGVDETLNAMRAAGFEDVAISVHTATLEAPSARWLGERISFAPGMAAMIAALGGAATAVVQTFVAQLEHDQGLGPIKLGGKAFVGCAVTPGGPKR